MDSQGDELLDPQYLRWVAIRVSNSWPQLALYLGFDNEQCQNIKAAFRSPREQAGQMLAAWRSAFTGGNSTEYLARALIEFDRINSLEHADENLNANAVKKIARGVGSSWQKLAMYLGFDSEECQAIKAAFPSPTEQAAQMLAAWKQSFTRDNPEEYLARALFAMDRGNVAKEIGDDALDIPNFLEIAKRIGSSWDELALYLGLDIDACTAIDAAFHRGSEKAGQVLAAWRLEFEGEEPIEYLARVLVAMDRGDIVTELGLLQRLPRCPCGNEDPVKFRRYYVKEVDSSTGIIGICCTCCCREWLMDRYLFHPDTDNTRHKVKLDGVVLKRQLEVPTESCPAFQVKGSRTKIENLNFFGDYLKVGDHITWHRPYLIWHHAIVSDIDVKRGKVKLIHWTKRRWGCGPQQIMELWVDLKSEPGELFRIDYPEEITRVNPPELVLARAKSRLGDTGYGLFGDNCEAFSSYCKIGVAESCQVLWVYKKAKEVIQQTLVTSTAKAACIGVKEYAKAGVKALLENAGSATLEQGVKATGKVAAAEAIEMAAQATNLVGAGLIFGMEGIACVWDLSKIYQNRTTGGLSRKDFIATTSQRVTEALSGAGLAVGGGIGGEMVGAAIGSIIFPGLGTIIGGFLGSIVGGAVGSVVGRSVGSVVGPQIGRALTSAIGTDDRAVKSIDDLKPGDQVVFYGNLLHPRHHAIVVEYHSAKAKVRVIHNTKHKGVVEEWVDFTTPVYRLVYEKRDCYPPDEVIRRARSKIGQKDYSLARYNCKSFARWCKQK